MPKHFRFVTTLLMFLVPATALGMDAFEYQVYDAEINKVGQYSLEIHLNTTPQGKSEPEYDGQVPMDHLTHLTLEFARGMTSYWELGLYLQSAFGPDGVGRYAGAKVRSKFVYPREVSEPYQFGLNFELANIPSRFERDRWGTELRPIFGYTWSRWTFTFNPILDVAVTPGAPSTPEIDPALKVQFDTHRELGVGLEYYSDFGNIDDLLPVERGEQYLFAAVDLLQSRFEFNLAVGRGLNRASNALIAKSIFGFDF